MGTFNYEEQEGKKYLIYNKKPEEKIDPVTMEMMSNNQIGSLLSFESIQIDGALTLKYNVTGLESLKDYFSGVVGKTKLLNVMEGIIEAFLEAEDYFLDLSSYVLEEEYIYIQPDTAKVFMVILPFVREEMKPESFLKKLLLEVHYDQSEDCSYVAGLINLFSGKEGTSLFWLQEQLLRFKEKKPNIKPREKKEEIRQQIPSPLQPMEDEPAQIYPYLEKERDKKVPFPESDMKKEEPAVETEKKKKGFFWKKEEKPEKQKPEKKGFFWKKSKKDEGKETDTEKGFPFAGLNIPGSEVQNWKQESPGEIYKPQETPIPAQRVHMELKDAEVQDFGPTEFMDDTSEETLFLDKAQNGPQPKMVLYRLSTQEVFEIQGDMVRIGRNPAISEICISGNRGIGRIHAILYVRKGQVGIADNDSKNKTYINGEQLNPGDDLRILSPGDKIQLADEELEFRIIQ